VNKTECGACARSNAAASFLTTASRQSFSCCRNVSSGEPWAGRLYVAGGGELAGGRCDARREERTARVRGGSQGLGFLLWCVADSRVMLSGRVTCSLEAGKSIIGACSLLCQNPHHHGTCFQSVQACMSGSKKSMYRIDGLAFWVASQTLTVRNPLFPRKFQS
jgi:hypothetical protein